MPASTAALTVAIASSRVVGPHTPPRPPPPSAKRLTSPIGPSVTLFISGCSLLPRPILDEPIQSRNPDRLHTTSSRSVCTQTIVARRADRTSDHAARAAPRTSRRSPRELLQKAARLVLPERGVVAATGEQLVVRAVLDDRAGLEDDQAIHAANGREPVGDHDRRAIPHQGPQRLLDVVLALGVQGAGGLVEDEDRGVLEQRARDGDPLALAAGQLDPALA